MVTNQMIESQTGYECKTTFAMDFNIAERFGVDAIKDTYERAFNEWKGNVVYLTELVMVLNWNIWAWYKQNEEIARVYNDLWQKAERYAEINLKGEDAEYYYRVLD